MSGFGAEYARWPNPMNEPQSFFRYVANRFRGRLAAANNSVMTAFVLSASVGKEVTSTKFWLSAVCGVLLYLSRILKAAFDSTFEAVGFLLGRLLLPWHLVVRITVGVTAFALVCFLLSDQTRWFIAFWGALFAINIFPALGTDTQVEPRLYTASLKAYLLVGVTYWAWEIGYVSAIVGFVLTHRAFQFFNEGMTIYAAELAQARRDHQTDAIYQSIKSRQQKQHPQEQIILYLRPFSITGQMKMDDGVFLEIADQSAIKEQHVPGTNEWQQTTIPIAGFNIGVSERGSLFEQGSDLESTIDQAMSGAGHFIALGQPGEAIGAGRLPTLESEWRETFELMIDAATLCIVIPSANEGTRSEIEYIVDHNLLGKCCFFMPPAIGNFSYEAAWRAAREALAAKLPLPEYQSYGGLLRCDGKTPASRNEAEPIPQDRSEMFAFYVQLLFPELPKWKVCSGPGWFHFGFGIKTAMSVRKSEGGF